MTINFNQKFYIWPSPELILLLGTLSDLIIKIIKLFYGIPKISNYWFATYYTYYKQKLEIIELAYNLYLFYKYS